MINEYTLKLPDYTDTMSRIVGDYTQIGRVKSNRGGYQSSLLEPDDMPFLLKQCMKCCQSHISVAGVRSFIIRLLSFVYSFDSFLFVYNLSPGSRQGGH